MKRSNKTKIQETKNLLGLLFEASNLSGFEIKKGERWSTFLQKIEKGEPFELYDVDGRRDGDLVVFPKDENLTLINALKEIGEDGSVDSYNKAFSKNLVVAYDTFGSRYLKPIKSSSLKKTKDFGGKGAGGSQKAEMKQFEQIQSQIESFKKGEKEILINLNNPNSTPRLVKVASAKRIGGSGSKADTELLNKDGVAVAYISLKAAKDPARMQQWAGVTKKPDGNGQYSKEIDDFVDKVKDFFKSGNELERGQVLASELDSDSDLAKRSTWGVDYKNDVSSNENCDIIIASMTPIKLEPRGGFYNFSGDNLWFKDEIIRDDNWKPVLVARNASDRSNLGISGVRIGLFPNGYVEKKKKESVIWLNKNSQKNDVFVEYKILMNKIFSNPKTKGSF